MKNQIMLTFFIAIFLLLSCGNKDKQTTETTAAVISSNTGKNYLSMKINGEDWVADNDIFGAFHPKGYDNAIMIAGSKGKKDKNEIAFNINIFNTNGPGDFSFTTGNKELSVAQIGNWSPDEYLCGSMMGFDMKVQVTKASTKPDIIEATFSGVLTCNTDKVMNITDGKFYYHE